MERTSAQSDKRKEKQADTIQQEEQEEQKRIASVKADYENDMQKELHKQGADTERLQDIAKQLLDIEQELLFIKDHATLLIEYQKDKRDLIDHIPEWKHEYEEQKRLLDNEKETLRKEISSLQGEIDKLSKSLNEAEENVRTFPTIWKPMKNLCLRMVQALSGYFPIGKLFRKCTCRTEKLY